MRREEGRRGVGWDGEGRRVKGDLPCPAVFSSSITTEVCSTSRGKMVGRCLKQHQSAIWCTVHAHMYTHGMHAHTHTLHTHTFTHTQSLQGVHPTMGTSHSKFTNYSFDVPEFMRLVTRLGDSVLQRKRESIFRGLVPIMAPLRLNYKYFDEDVN